MRDILESLSNDVVTFTAQTERGREWMATKYHETIRRYVTKQPIERAEEERFRQEAAADKIDVYI